MTEKHHLSLLFVLEIILLYVQSHLTEPACMHHCHCHLSLLQCVSHRVKSYTPSNTSQYLILTGDKVVLVVPFPSSRSGNLGDMANAGSVHEYLVELHETYGNIVGFWWGKEYVVSLSSTDFWKEIQPIFDKPCKLARKT